MHICIVKIQHTKEQIQRETCVSLRICFYRFENESETTPIAPRGSQAKKVPAKPWSVSCTVLPRSTLTEKMNLVGFAAEKKTPATWLLLTPLQKVDHFWGGLVGNPT